MNSIRDFKIKVKKKKIEEFLQEAKRLISENKFNVSNRDKNASFLEKYIIDESGRKAILLDLTADDLSKVEFNNNVSPNDEYQVIYFFGKTVCLIERFTGLEHDVGIYIKMRKKDLPSLIIVISFHEQEFPVEKYKFWFI